MAARPSYVRKKKKFSSYTYPSAMVEKPSRVETVQGGHLHSKTLERVRNAMKRDTQFRLLTQDVELDDLELEKWLANTNVDEFDEKLSDYLMDDEWMQAVPSAGEGVDDRQQYTSTAAAVAAEGSIPVNIPKPLDIRQNSWLSREPIASHARHDILPPLGPFQSAKVIASTTLHRPVQKAPQPSKEGEWRFSNSITESLFRKKRSRDTKQQQMITKREAMRGEFQ
ncbi:hypothetical protein HK102_009696 [Quaeritorhiza haematococci]|nr:hypothetical protein HK102_009696 [Quaeritorhiza haematococci]